MGIDCLFSTLLKSKSNRTLIRKSKKWISLQKDYKHTNDRPMNHEEHVDVDQTETLEEEQTETMEEDSSDPLEYETLESLENIYDCMDDKNEINDEKIACNKLCIDFNTIMYMIANDIEKNIRYIMYSKIIGKIDNRCRKIMKNLDPQFNIDANVNPEILNVNSDILNQNSEISNPNPDILNPNPDILNPNPDIINPNPNIINPNPDIINPNPDVFNQNTEILNDDSKNNMEEWCQMFKKHVSKCVTEWFIFAFVKQYINDLIDNLLDEDVIEEIFISIDGMPTMTKIVEQKRRRQMRCISNGLRKRMYNKHKSEIEKDRIMYETYLYTFDRSMMAPMSEFMDTLCMYLNSNTLYQKDMKNKYKSLKRIIISSHHICGEGEIKIMNHILNTYNSDEQCVIFSPDSDVIILSTIIRNRLIQREKTNKISLLRYNAFNNTYNYININKLYEELFECVQNKTSHKLDKENVINDICFIITIFGNDFIPKLESVCIKTDLDIVLDVYVQTIETYKSMNTDMYVTYHNKCIYMINYAVFSKFIENLSQHEMHLLRNKYMYKTYANMNKIKKIFHETLLYPHLIQYIQFANIIYSVRCIKLNKKVNKEKQLKELNDVDELMMQINVGQIEIDKTVKNVGQIEIDKTVRNVLTKIKEQFNDSELLTRLINRFIKIEKVKIEYNDESSEIKLKSILEKILTDPSIIPRMVLIFKNPNVKTKFHQMRIKNQFAHPLMKVTGYDEKLYMMNECICQYKNKFSPDYEIGFLRMSNKHKYSYETSFVVKDSYEYYNRYFNIDILSKNPKKNIKLNNIIGEYVKGLFWIFNFYMNNNDETSNTWFYPYSHTPLLFHISKYISNMNQNSNCKNYMWMNQINENIFLKKSDKLDNDKKKIMSPLEYYIYVNPHHKLDCEIVGKKLYEQIKDHKELFDDMNDIIDRIWDGHKNVIDIRYTFLNKGRIINQKMIKYDDWKNFLKQNKIIVLEDTYQLENIL